MQFVTSRTFDKQFKKLEKKVKLKFIERRNLLMENPLHPQLNNHQLVGEYKGCNSINVTGDYRAIYTQGDKEICAFIAIGTHGELYG